MAGERVGELKRRGPRGSGSEAAAASLLGGCWSLGPAGSLIRSDHLLQEKHLLGEAKKWWWKW